ncbi:MAG: carboxypeptidase-like regulatory domain-containing protein [Bacteroidota bacterium]
MICTLVLSSHILANKNYVEGMVLNENGEGLGYVNIGIISTSLGTVSNENGGFKLFFNETITSQDTIRFSSIGYAHQDFLIEELRNRNFITIKMQVRSTTLGEVVVLPDFKKTKIKGSRKTKTRMNVSYSIGNQPNQNLGAEIGRKFKIRKTTQLKKLRFYIAKNNFDTVRFRVNVYHLKKRKPSENLLSQNIIVEVVDSKTGWIEVDLAPYRILSKKSIVVGVEWIYHSERGRYLTLPIALAKKGPHFYKYGSQNKWKRFATMSSAMEIEVAY